jgi:hypothetical protein
MSQFNWGEGTWGITELWLPRVDDGIDAPQTGYPWGSGQWGESELFRTDASIQTFIHDNTRDVWENYDNNAIQIEQNDPLHTVIHALQTDVDRFDAAVRKQYRNLFVETASGPFLDLLADRYNLNRRSNESDSRLRRRIKARIAAASSDGSFDDLASIVLFVLDAAPNQVRLLTPSNTGTEATVIVQTTTEVLDATKFSNDEIVDLLNDSVPIGAAIELRTDGTFQFDGPNYTPDPNTGFGEGTWGGSFE